MTFLIVIYRVVVLALIGYLWVLGFSLARDPNELAVIYLALLVGGTYAMTGGAYRLRRKLLSTTWGARFKTP